MKVIRVSEVLLVASYARGITLFFQKIEALEHRLNTNPAFKAPDLQDRYAVCGSRTGHGS